MNEVAWIADRDLDAVQAGWMEREMRACAGAAPYLAERVRISRVEEGAGGFAGGAYVEGGAVVRVELSADAGPSILAHEIGHAWAPAGPDFLREGIAGALGTCGVGALHGARARSSCGPDTYAALSVPVRSWTRCADASCGGDPAARAQMEAAYLASEQLVRTWLAAGGTVGDLVSDGVVDWSRVDLALEGRGLVDLLDATWDPPALARQLSDEDCDGQTYAAERAAGTDPTRWDSDGDGWWDGVAPRPGYVPLPADGSPICLTGAASPTIVRFWTDLDQRGWLRLAGGAPLGPGAHLVRRPGPLVARVVAPGSAGGAAVAWEPREGPLCRASGEATVWTEEAGLEGWVRSVHQAAAWAGPHRVSVRLVSDGEFGFERPGYTVVVPVSALDRHRDGAAYAAALAQGWSLARDLDPRSAARAVAAFADARAPGRPSPIEVSAEDRREWSRTAAACEGGWTAVLTGTCG